MNRARLLRLAEYLESNEADIRNATSWWRWFKSDRFTPWAIAAELRALVKEDEER